MTPSPFKSPTRARQVRAVLGLLEERLAGGPTATSTTSSSTTTSSSSSSPSAGDVLQVLLASKCTGLGAIDRCLRLLRAGQLSGRQAVFCFSEIRQVS